MSDADFELAYRKYKDSLGAAYSKEIASVTVGEGSSLPVNNSGFANDNEGFVDVAVVFDSDEGQLPKEIRDKLLSQPGFHVVESDDGTREYVVRGYNTLEEAMAAMDQFKKDGMEVKGIAKVSEDEALEFVSQELIDKARAELLVSTAAAETSIVSPVDTVMVSSVDTSIVISVDTSMVSSIDTSIVSSVDTTLNAIDINLETTYRVQIGAFRKELSTSVFSDAREVVYTEGDDDLFRYYSGSSDEKSKAAEHRIALLEMGYEGSFIVAFRDGKRIKLSEANFDVVDSTKDVIVEAVEPTGIVVRRELVRFRVQVGEYTGNVPTEVLDIYLEIGDVTFKRDPESGLIRSFLGWFETYDEAEEFQAELEREGLNDTFVIGDFNGKIISAQETLELLNE
jgi:N-acetylmuramoyl-L-alanine amidase